MTPEDTAEKVRNYLDARFGEVEHFVELAQYELDLNSLITLIDTQDAEIQELTAQLMEALEGK